MGRSSGVLRGVGHLALVAAVAVLAVATGTLSGSRFYPSDGRDCAAGLPVALATVPFLAALLAVVVAAVAVDLTRAAPGSGTRAGISALILFFGPPLLVLPGEAIMPGTPDWWTAWATPAGYVYLTAMAPALPAVGILAAAAILVLFGRRRTPARAIILAVAGGVGVVAGAVLLTSLVLSGCPGTELL